MTLVYLLIIALALFLSFGRRRIVTLCLFLCIYGTLKVMAQDEDAAVNWSQLLLFRALYPILLLSAVVRYFRDSSLAKQMALWPKSYVLFVGFMLFSASYSPSRHVFEAGQSNVWGWVVIALLFVLSAAHIQVPEDFTLFAKATVATSLSLALWVLWSTVQVGFFSAFRGGVDVNQNYVSLFELAGALPLLHWLFIVSGFWRKLTVAAMLAAVLVAAGLLQSRGLMIAFAVAALAMTPRLIPQKPAKSVLLMALCLALAAAGMYSLGMFDRFSDLDVASANGRALVWRYAISQFAEPGPHWLFGFGYNSADWLLPWHMETGLWNYHNEYLNSLMDGGLIGLTLLTVFLVSVWRSISHSSHELKNVSRGWFAFLAVACLSGVFSGSHIFCLLFGAIVGVRAAERYPSRVPLAHPVRDFYQGCRAAIHRSIERSINDGIA